jgi:hypothetical protein
MITNHLTEHLSSDETAQQAQQHAK